MWKVSYHRLWSSHPQKKNLNKAVINTLSLYLVGKISCAMRSELGCSVGVCVGGWKSFSVVLHVWCKTQCWLLSSKKRHTPQGPWVLECKVVTEIFYKFSVWGKLQE